MNRLLAATALIALAQPARAETIADAIASAYATNPTLAEARARQEALAETPEQARAAGRLSVSADAAGGYSRFDYGKGGAATVSAVQPVWTGDRVESAVRAARADVAAGGEGVRDTEARVLESVVQVYAGLLYDQQAAAIATADIALLDNEVADSRARFGLGNSTRTDVARLEAQRASAGATLAAAQAQVATDVADYRALVGHDPGRLAPAPAILAALPGTLDQAREQALAANPLYRQSQRTAEADRARIDGARAGGNPYLAIGASYGYDANLARDADRTYKRAADAALTLHVPILTGGLVASQVRQASATYRADRFQTDAQAREALRATDAAWAGFTGSQARAKADADSVAAAELALKGVRAEYAFGLRSTLDILVADESLRGAQLALARDQVDLLVAQAALLHQTGRLNEAAYGAPAAPPPA